MKKEEKTDSNKKPRKAPLVYINRLEMAELDKENKYEFIPNIIDDSGRAVDREELSEDDKKKFDRTVKHKINYDKRKHMILTAESELIRIVRFLSKENEVSRKRTKKSGINRDYVENMLSLKVGRS